MLPAQAAAAFARLETAERLNPAQIEERARALRDQLSFDEKVSLMHGQLALWPGLAAINDGRWHSVQCWRTEEGVGLAIDGSTVATREGPTGNIANNWPLSIGGKTDCDQIVVGCDYFAGDLDEVEVQAVDHDW